MPMCPLSASRTNKKERLVVFHPLNKSTAPLGNTSRVAKEPVLDRPLSRQCCNGVKDKFDRLFGVYG